MLFAVFCLDKNRYVEATRQRFPSRGLARVYASAISESRNPKILQVTRLLHTPDKRPASAEIHFNKDFDNYSISVRIGMQKYSRSFPDLDSVQLAFRDLPLTITVVGLKVLGYEKSKGGSTIT